MTTNPTGAEGMMAWWNRKAATGKIIEPRGGYAWENSRGQMNGLPAYLRVNATLKKGAPHPGYVSLVVVSIAFQTAGANGMPQSEEELNDVDAIEDRIKATLESGGTTVLALVLTNAGARLLRFYTSDPRAAIHLWEHEIAPTIETHSVDFTIQPDPRWEQFLEVT